MPRAVKKDKEVQAQRFKRDVEHWFDELRIVMRFYGVGDWSAQLILRKPKAAGSYFAVSSPDDDPFIDQMVAMHAAEGQQ